MANDTDSSLGKVVAAVICNRSFEVGIAFMDLEHPVLFMNQITDNRKFDVTLRLLHSYGTDLVLYPATHKTNPLFGTLSRLADTRKDLELELYTRRFFSEDRGMERLLELTANELDPRDVELRYLARAAVAALLQYVETSEEALFERKSLRVNMDDSVQGRLLMDPVTIGNLELLVNKRAVLGKKIEGGCLLDFLDCTLTKSGSRLIRSDLASPPCDLKTIHQRQELIKELIANESTLQKVRDHLTQYHDTDQLTTHYCVVPKKYQMQTLKREADNAIRIREVLQLTPDFIKLLKTLQSDMALQMAATLESHQQVYERLVSTLNEQLNEEAKFQRGVEEQRVQAIFCIRPDLDGILDVARSAYVEVVAKMKSYLTKVNEELERLGRRPAELAFTTKRGYHLRVPKYRQSKSKRQKKMKEHHHDNEKDDEGGDDLDARFIQVVSLKTRWDCTTEELVRLNLKQEQAVNEALCRTEGLLAHLRQEIQKELPALFDLGDSLALFDLVQSLACVSGQDCLCCPTFFVPGSEDNNQTPFNISGGRHLIVEHAMDDPTEYQPNGICFEQNDNRLAIVTGPNCSGKSTILKQTALICIMGHMGCFVPATSANLPLIDRILTRIGNEDNLEAGASTFSLEMTETAYILNTPIRPDSYQLILIDELGRGTSSIEGLSLAWAVAEHLLTRKHTYTLYVTHFTEMKWLAPLRFGFRLDTTEDNEFFETHRMEAYRNNPNTPEEENEPNINYGLHLASSFGLPQTIVSDAFQYRDFLNNQRSITQARQQQLNVLLRDQHIMSLTQIRKVLSDLAK